MENLIEIEGKYFKKCNIVILPTNKPTNVVLHSTGLDPYHNTLESAFNAVENIGGQYQHLYITSDDEIKENDWCYNIKTNQILQYLPTKEHLKNTRGILNVLLHLNKIIATTDKSLTIGKEHDDTVPFPKMKDVYLPQPSQAFIEKYCKVDGIDEVLVEYEDNITCKVTSICKQYSSNTDKVCIGYCKYSQLKVDSHNTITIHPVKINYTDKEVKLLLEEYRLFIWKNGTTKIDLQKFIKSKSI